MLPIEHGSGQIWLHDQFLCDVEYDISEPHCFGDGPQIQRVSLTVVEEHCAMLLDAYELTLITADGSHHPIPRPIRHDGREHLECYVED